MVHEVLKVTADKLHLAEHEIESQSNSIHTMCVAGDVEIHDVDGFFYILDLGRVFPPLDPQTYSGLCGLSTHPHSIFYRKFRPEFLYYLHQSEATPKLSSDALSGWGAIDANLHARNVISATTNLVQERIPHLAHIVDEEIRTIGDDIAYLFHSSGVNMFFLGYVGSLCTKDASKLVLCFEIVVRSLKHILRNILQVFKEDSESWNSPFNQKQMLPHS